MENTQIILVVFIAFLIIIMVWKMYSNTEKFSSEFNTALESSEFMQYLDLGDHRTMVKLLKGNSGKTVLLLHNSPMTLNIWQPLYQTMQRISMTGVKTPNLVSFDLRGHGTAWIPVESRYNDTNPNNSAWTLDDFVNDTKKVYDSVIGGGKIIVCGFGFGGFVSQKFALTYPDIIEKLVLLQTSVRPVTGLLSEINYFGGPNGWIAKNPGVTYLTMEEKYVQQMLCDWFYSPDPKCPPSSQFKDYNDETAPQYNLAAKMLRQGSCTSLLQTDKLLVNINLIKDWQDAKVSFTVHILAGTDDPLATPDIMTEAYTDIYNTNRHLLVVFDTVHGRHGFTIMRPDYIAGIVCDNCEKLGSKDTYVRKLSDHGF